LLEQSKANHGLFPLIEVLDDRGAAEIERRIERISTDWHRWDQQSLTWQFATAAFPDGVEPETRERRLGFW
jgi:hypothetical protein